MKKPTVTLRCPANCYSGPQERIIEVGWGHGSQYYGTLIALHGTAAGLIIDIYRADAGIRVRCDPSLLTPQQEA